MMKVINSGLLIKGNAQGMENLNMKKNNVTNGNLANVAFALNEIDQQFQKTIEFMNRNDKIIEHVIKKNDGFLMPEFAKQLVDYEDLKASMESFKMTARFDSVYFKMMMSE